jgi:hypothetical protein
MKQAVVAKIKKKLREMASDLYTYRLTAVFLRRMPQNSLLLALTFLLSVAESSRQTIRSHLLRHSSAAPQTLSSIACEVVGSTLDH